MLCGCPEERGSGHGHYPALNFGLILEDARTLSFRMRLQEQPYDDEGTELSPGPVHDATLRAPLRARLGTWVHVVATHRGDDGVSRAGLGGSGGDMRLYVNGTQVASKIASGYIPNSPSQPVVIGGIAPKGPFFAGGLDEVALYLYSLDAARVRAHFARATRGCVNVREATERRYQLSNLDRGSRLRVRVTACNAQESTTVTSAQTPVIAPEPPPSEDPATETPTYAPGPMPDLPEPPDPAAPSSRPNPSRNRCVPPSVGGQTEGTPSASAALLPTAEHGRNDSAMRASTPF